VDLVAPALSRFTGAARAAPADFVALTKPRIVMLVVATTAGGWYLGLAAAPNAPTSFAAALWVLAHTMLGTALVAAGTNALNQVWERDVDALMRRTRLRPLPAGRLTTMQATTFACTVALLGTIELAFFVNVLTAVLAVATLVSYVFAYTPLKRLTTTATLVGAIPGALPIVGGWTSSGAPLDARAAALFAIMFLWQIPHFLALSWMYREDYARAGMRMLSVGDEGGGMTFRQAALNSVALLPIVLVVRLLGIAGSWYAFGATLLTVGLVVLATQAARAPTAHNARRLFHATLVYLPALLILMIADRIS
jgi:heme o synthase